jgi:hypothetical protein
MTRPIAAPLAADLRLELAPIAEKAAEAEITIRYRPQESGGPLDST